jgi:hypothetical protein
MVARNLQTKGTPMPSVGFVMYKKSDEPGTLIAEWCHSDYGNGTGIATGGPADGF